VPAPLTSRQILDCTPVMVPLALNCHCWLAPPVHCEITTGVPLVVWLFRAVAHRVLPPL
jgi:hypothetical protein